jgi:hypothetical protein
MSSIRQDHVLLGDEAIILFAERVGVGAPRAFLASAGGIDRCRLDTRIPRAPSG